MFVKLLLFLIIIYSAYFVGNLLLDMYRKAKMMRDEEEVIIDMDKIAVDISKSVEKYKAKDASEVVQKESEQNRKERTEEEEAGVPEYDNQERDGKMEPDDEMEDGDERYDEEDYAPMNASDEYDPLEFRKMLQDSMKSENRFAFIFQDAEDENAE